MRAYLEGAGMPFFFYATSSKILTLSLPVKEDTFLMGILRSSPLGILYPFIPLTRSLNGLLETDYDFFS